MNNLEKLIEESLRDSYSEGIKLLISCRYVFSREKNLSDAKYDYDNLICFCNNPNYPDLVIYDEAEDEKKVELFYKINEIDEISEKFKINKIFIDNLKKGLYSKDLKETFKDLLNTVYRNNAFNFIVHFIYDGYLPENQFKGWYEKFSSETDIDVYGDFHIFDRKKLNAKYLGEEQEELGEQSNNLNYGFTIVNPHNDGTNLRNTFEYSSNNMKILLCTFEGYSLVSCYQKFGDKIFDRNIRYAVTSGSASKSVDESIKQTIENEAKNFLIYNNGITIVTEEIDVDIYNNKVNLRNFSIVNGAQTVSNLAKFFKIQSLQSRVKDTMVIVKIVSPKSGDFDELVEKITKASNNQKPVLPRDFRSNSREMLELKDFFKKNGVILDIKRGENHKIVTNYIEKELKILKPAKILNDVLAQYILSLLLVSPTVANQNKSKLFDDKFYNKIFKNQFLTPEIIFSCYQFYSQTKEKLEKINIEIAYNEFENVRVLKKGIENWIILILWIIANNYDNLETIVNISNINKLTDSTGILYNETQIKKFKGFDSETLHDFVYEIYKEISELFSKSYNKKGDPSSPSAFSFQKESLEKLIVKMMISRNTEKIQNKVENLRTLFL